MVRFGRAGCYLKKTGFLDDGKVKNSMAKNAPFYNFRYGFSRRFVTPWISMAPRVGCLIDVYDLWFSGTNLALKTCMSVLYVSGERLGSSLSALFILLLASYSCSSILDPIVHSPCGFSRRVGTSWMTMVPRMGCLIDVYDPWLQAWAPHRLGAEYLRSCTVSKR